MPLTPSPENNGLRAIRDERHVDDKVEIERLHGEIYKIQEKKWDDISKKLDALPAIQASLTEINTRCIPCQKQLQEHDYVLRGDPHTGSLGVVQMVAASKLQTDKQSMTLYGNPEIGTKGLVHKQEVLNNKISLIWKLTVGALGAVIVGGIGILVRKIWPA